MRPDCATKERCNAACYNEGLGIMQTWQELNMYLLIHCVSLMVLGVIYAMMILLLFDGSSELF